MRLQVVGTNFDVTFTEFLERSQNIVCSVTKREKHSTYQVSNEGTVSKYGIHYLSQRAIKNKSCTLVFFHVES